MSTAVDGTIKRSVLGLESLKKMTESLISLKRYMSGVIVVSL